jgi:GNAT superfamily N-acetyltransferase
LELLLPRIRPKLRLMDGQSIVEIRRANLAEVETAFRLVEEYFGALKIVKREDQQEFTREYFGDGRGLWLARVNRELAGCVAVRPLPVADNPMPDRTSCAELKRMFVREQFRGQGVARRLLEEAEAFARASEYTWIFLDTELHMTDAARLYERNGYARCARYNHNPQGMIAMRKSIS